MYAKLIDGSLAPAPNKVTVDGMVIYNPGPDLLLSLGYKPVEYTPAPIPPAGYREVPGWQELEDRIIQTWTEEETPVPPPPGPPVPSQIDRIEAQVLYTALMTDTLLEEEEED